MYKKGKQLIYEEGDKVHLLSLHDGPEGTIVSAPGQPWQRRPWSGPVYTVEITEPRRGKLTYSSSDEDLEPASRDPMKSRVSFDFDVGETVRWLVTGEPTVRIVKIISNTEFEIEVEVDKNHIVTIDEIEVLDPTPWCSSCEAMMHRHCQCGPSEPKGAPNKIWTRKGRRAKIL